MLRTLQRQKIVILYIEGNSNDQDNEVERTSYQERREGGLARATAPGPGAR